MFPAPELRCTASPCLIAQCLSCTEVADVRHRLQDSPLGLGSVCLPVCKEDAAPAGAVLRAGCAGRAFGVPRQRFPLHRAAAVARLELRGLARAAALQEVLDLLLEQPELGDGSRAACRTHASPPPSVVLPVLPSELQ